MSSSDLSISKSSAECIAAVASRSLPLQQRLPQDSIQKIATYFTLRDWGRFSQTNREIHTLLNSEESTREICPILYREIEKLYPNIRKLGKLGANPLLGLPEYKEPKPESLKSLEDYVVAGFITKLSEDACSTIVTLPKDWSIENLEALSDKAVSEGILSAEIRYHNPSYKTILQNNPIKETQTIAISNTIVRGTLGTPIDLDLERFPDPLTVLTAAVLTAILAPNQNLYKGTYTLTNKKTLQGLPLCVGTDTDHFLETNYLNVSTPPNRSAIQGLHADMFIVGLAYRVGIGILWKFKGNGA